MVLVSVSYDNHQRAFKIFQNTGILGPLASGVNEKHHPEETDKLNQPNVASGKDCRTSIFDQNGGPSPLSVMSSNICLLCGYILFHLSSHKWSFSWGFSIECIPNINVFVRHISSLCGPMIFSVTGSCPVWVYTLIILVCHIVFWRVTTDTWISSWILSNYRQITFWSTHFYRGRRLNKKILVIV